MPHLAVIDGNGTGMVPTASRTRSLVERQMACKNRIRTLALVAALLGVTGLASAARADVVFANATDQDVVFTFHCPGGDYDRWTIPSGDRLSLYCRNGASTASIRIVTDEDSGDRMVVSGRVYDGRTYRIDYDADGDVSYQPIG